MKLEIVQLESGKFEVQGQEVSRAFAEGVMLAGLFASCGRNVDRIVSICDQYVEAGLSLDSFPAENRKAHLLRNEIAREEEKRRKANEFFSERSRQMAEAYDPLVIARKKAEREVREAAIREHGRSIRAARSGNGRAFMGHEEGDTWA